ncbi:MAG: hypothetical protein AAGB25_07865, partial [Pseudomonadota bacterium]
MSLFTEPQIVKRAADVIPSNVLQSFNVGRRSAEFAGSVNGVLTHSGEFFVSFASEALFMDGVSQAKSPNVYAA